MLGKCLATSLFLFFLFLTLVFYNSGMNPFRGPDLIAKLILSSDSSCSYELRATSPGPSLESFIQASITDQGSELRFSGLAVTSRLKNACQPLTDVSKAKIPANKIALVFLQELEDEIACPMQDLALEAQRAGYSVLIYFTYFANMAPTDVPTRSLVVPSKEILLIPVLEARANNNHDIDDCAVFLANADTTNAEISIQVGRPFSQELNSMKSYLVNLYYWFLVGPIITLEWMRRTKKFCLHSGRHERGENLLQPEGENQVETDAEIDIRTMEEGENRTGEPVQRLACRERPAEEQPLLSAVSTDSHDVKHCPRGSGHVKKYHSICDKAAIGLGYLILVLAALPVGLSAGGLSFFRFDDPGEYKDISGYSSSSFFSWPKLFIDLEVPVWWSPFQIFCFFMYSHFACGNQRTGTWTISTKFSKLIRNDWFASNIYLLALGVVEPICSSSDSAFGGVWLFRFTFKNSINTLCNFLFLIILNKHKVVTRYVFYISVCMICAYIESDVVALYYFALNSQGSLQNVKLTAIRTAAISLTLIVSFRTSMHIIRKLINPRQSLFEGLSEQ